MYKVFKIGRDLEDPEKTILPAIVFINATHPAFKNQSTISCIGFRLKIKHERN